jgi:CopG family transcriptional regulator, nickel-responsive regulator
MLQPAITPTAWTNMGKTSRFSVSVDSALLDRFSRTMRKRGHHNRSQALSDIIRESLVREEWQGNDEIVGTITIVYDHHKRELTDRLTSIQHDHHHAVLAETHIHLDHDNCLEMIAVRGTASEVQKIADALIGTRGVKHGKLNATTTGKKLR